MNCHLCVLVINLNFGVAYIDIYWLVVASLLLHCTYHPSGIQHLILIFSQPLLFAGTVCVVVHTLYRLWPSEMLFQLFSSLCGCIYILTVFLQALFYQFSPVCTVLGSPRSRTNKMFSFLLNQLLLSLALFSCTYISKLFHFLCCRNCKQQPTL